MYVPLGILSKALTIWLENEDAGWKVLGTAHNNGFCSLYSVDPDQPDLDNPRY